MAVSVSPDSLKAWYSAPCTAGLRWEPVAGVMTYAVYYQLDNNLGTWVLVQGDVATNSIDVLDENFDNHVVFFKVTATQTGHTESLGVEKFVLFFSTDEYGKELKAVVTQVLLQSSVIRSLVSDRVYHKQQPVNIVYPLLIFSINEYSNQGQRWKKDITLTCTVFTRDKAVLDQVRIQMSLLLADFTYGGKEMRLHKLIEQGGTGEVLDQGDGLTWSLEVTFQGKITILKLK